MNLFILLVSFITCLMVLMVCVKLFFYFIAKKPFPQKLSIATLSAVVLTLALIGYTRYLFTYDQLEGEFYKGPVISPTGNYTANAYYMTYGGAAGGVNVWVEVTYHEEDKTQIVYYSDAKTSFWMEWKNDNTLFIVNREPDYPASNRSIELEIGQEIYHETGLACDSLLMKDEYEVCYQD